MNLVSREEIVPLTPHAMYVLTALAYRPLSAYDLYSQCRADTNNEFNFNRRNLYRTARNLTKWGLAAIKGNYASYGSPHNRTVYQITSQGKLVLGWEANRYLAAAELASLRLKILESHKKPAILNI